MTLGSNKSEKQIVWHEPIVSRTMREKLNGHKSAILWFTGLSGSGKSTIAHSVEAELYQMGCSTIVFDGDNIRHGLCNDLGFSNTDRTENIRRIGEVAKLFLEAGVIAMTAFISPFRSDRLKIRNLVAPGDFIEIYCRCSIETCEKRDTKGFYKKARRGEIKDFTGISSPYEGPEEPNLVLDTDVLSIEESARKVLDLLINKKILKLEEG